MTGRARTVLALAGGLAATTLLSSCGWTGPNQFALPGAAGGGDGAWEVQIELPDVTTLTENARVRVGDVNVGTVRRIEVDGDHALITVSLDEQVRLPANATAKIGSTSLLGSAHVELLAPPQPAGELCDGDRIPLDRGGAYPTTEQTLSTLSFLLNGGGIGKLEEINREVALALSGRADVVRNLLTNVEDFTTRLNAQRNDLIRALEGIDRFAQIVADDRQVVEDGVATLAPALSTLNEQRDDLAAALLAIGDFADAANEVITGSRAELDANLRALEPTLRGLADAGPALPSSLSFLGTIPFPLNTYRNAIQGDFANLFLNLDLTTARLDRALLTGTPAAGQLASLGGLIGQLPPIAPTSDNPLFSPLNPPSRGGN
ncbi:MCE family protein [Rhodococcus sp. MSC1_016]|jgi:phospholipid/cholesterol/gamma-HCH transport system substrate-binding protein|uniref:MCE family protein n=1 Tax=Rhodococcus sp. MSC1_016 TaxID=2909266 RepID=UPI00202E8D6D|nr:MCE family protein [Rhodococcus sp. MSC1_016]